MRKPKFLYHGSAKELIGNKLIPKKAKDLGKKSENLHTAVYATKKKQIAIAMAIISCRGVYKSSLSFNKSSKSKTYGTIHIGWPKQEYIYLYTLSSKTFKPTDKRGLQWISEKAVKPEKIDKLLVKDYIKLVKKVNKKE
ncbi:MAG: hypothetical protein KJ906_04050 [Nanoarchaeota archaeon]|nr:hypothetical protein [Nanoarchaeota archaeon]